MTSAESREDGPPAAGRAAPRFRRNLFLTFGTNLAILGVAFTTGTLNARLLGPTGRGELAAIQTFPTVLGALALLGLPSAVGYYSAQRPKEARTFTVIAAIIGLIASLPAIVIGYLMMPWVLHQQSPVVIHDARIFLALVSMHVVLLPYVALQGIGGFKVWNLLRLAPNLANLSAILIATGAGHRTSGAFAKTYLVLYALTMPIAYGVFWRNSSRAEASTRSHAQRARELLRYGLPSALMLPANLLNLQLDQLLMAAWLPSNLLGLYAVSFSWSSLLSPAFGALGSMVFPALAAAADPEARRAIVARSTRLAVLLVVILGVGLAAFTPVMLPLLFGRSFASAIPAALILVAASMLLNLNGVCADILRGLGAPRWPLFSQLAALPVTVCLLIVLLPRWSIVGAAISSLIAYLVMVMVSFRGVSLMCQLSMSALVVPRRSDVGTVSTAIRDVVRRVVGQKK